MSSSQREAAPDVSLVATVRNEERSLPMLLNSIESQTRPPSEVVFVDGGSTDGTVPLLNEWASAQPYPVRVLQEPGCNIARGRNLGIEAASHHVLAVTDAGVTLEPRWLDSITAPFADEDPPDVVAGLFVGDSTGVFHTAMCATVLPLPEEIDAERFLPSSRSIAFTKTAWLKIGGYPEWADYCEDVLFDMALLAAGCRMVLASQAVVHFSPRRSLPAFWRQYRNYAFGDGQTLLWTHRHLIRFSTYLLSIPALAWAALAVTPWALAGYLLGGAIYLRRPLVRLRLLTEGWPLRERLAAVCYVPVIRVCGDLAKMAGYPQGLPTGLALRKLNDAYKSGRVRRSPGVTEPHDRFNITTEA